MANKKAKELLIHAAINLFYKKGYSNASVRDIGKAAKLNPRLLHYYFENKEEILYIIAERYCRHLIKELKEIKSRESDPIKCLKEMFIRHVSFNSEHAKETKIAFEEFDLLRGKRSTQIFGLIQEISSTYVGQLQQLKKSNLLLDINLNILNFLIPGILSWFYAWFIQRKKFVHQMKMQLQSQVDGDAMQINEVNMAGQIFEIIFSRILKGSRNP